MKIKLYLSVMIILGSFFLMTFSVTPVVPKQSATPTIKIGGLGPLAILPGLDMEKGMNLAINQTNDNGGVKVGGTNYTLTPYYATTSGSNGEPDIQTGTNSLTTLEQDDGVVAIVGGFRTEVVTAVELSLGTTPFLGVGSTAPIITPYFWRVGPTNGTELAYSLIGFYHFYMVNHGVRNITIVREDADWSLAISKGIKGAFAGYFPTDNVSFANDIVISTSASQSDVQSALSNVNSSTNALLELFSAPVGQYVTQAWANLNMTQYLAGINVQAQISSYFQDTAGGAYGEIELETTSPNSTNPNGIAFRNAFKAKYGQEPTYTAYAAYDAVQVIIKALEKSSAPTSAQIQINLDSTNYNGTSSLIKFTDEKGPQHGVDSNGNPSNITGVDYSTPMTVHDLFTTSGIATSGGIYANPVFVQWQKNGAKNPVYVDLAGFLANKYTAQWPINHADSGYTSKAAGAPGFEFFIAIFAITATIIIKKRKNFKI